jgi:acetoin:2,6-dichlorophenolindophenol oxidoreductase subunit beta
VADGQGTLEFRVAIREGLADELAADPAVFLLGEDVAAAGGVFKVTEGLLERFGPDRVLDTPISELALAGAAFGSAILGRRPVVEIMFGDFVPLVMDGLVNQAAKYRYLSGGRHTVPLVVRCAVGAGGRFGAIHSQIPGTWLHGVPGLKVVCPATPTDARVLIRQAIRDPDPVVFLEHKRLYGVRGPAQEAPSPPLGRARVVRAGTDVTIASVMKGVADALEAADALAARGISAEVVDLRSLRPLDVETVVASVERTNRLVAVEEGSRTGGWAAGLLGAVAEDALDTLDAAWTVTTPDEPVPFSPALEDAFLPGPERIAASVAEQLQPGPQQGSR